MLNQYFRSTQTWSAKTINEILPASTPHDTFLNTVISRSGGGEVPGFIGGEAPDDEKSLIRLDD